MTGDYNLKRLAQLGDKAYPKTKLRQIVVAMSLDQLYELLQASSGFKPASGELERRMKKWTLDRLAEVHARFDNRVPMIAQVVRQVACQKMRRIRSNQSFFEQFIELVGAGHRLIAKELTDELTKRMSRKKESWLVEEAKTSWHLWSDCAFSALATKTELGETAVETFALQIAKDSCGFEVEKVVLEWFKTHRYQLSPVAVEALRGKVLTTKLPDSRRYAEVISRWLPQASTEMQIKLLKNELVYEEAMHSEPRTEQTTMMMWSVKDLINFIESCSNFWACGSAKDVLLKKLEKMRVADLQSLVTGYHHQILIVSAIEALASRKTISNSSIDSITSRISSESEVVAKSAINAVATAKLTQAKPDIIHALDVSKSEEVRHACLKAMAIFVGDYEIAMRLRDFIAESKSPLEAHYATESLCAIGYAKMLQPLCEKKS